MELFFSLWREEEATRRRCDDYKLARATTPAGNDAALIIANERERERERPIRLLPFLLVVLFPVGIFRLREIQV